MGPWNLEHRLPPLWRPDPPDAAFVAAFSTRHGGVSAAPYDTLNIGRSTADRPEDVERNRSRVLAALGLGPTRLATAGQVHGATVTEATAPGLHPACDALVTRIPGLALAVSSADCLPVLFHAPGVVAAAHSGWRGTALGIAAATLDALCRIAGVGPATVSAHFGPGIRACCYEVGAEVARQFPAETVRPRGERFSLDVPAAVRRQLIEVGMRAERIADVGACSMCSADGYFSHRRDRGLTGRQWGVVALAVAPDES